MVVFVQCYQFPFNNSIYSLCWLLTFFCRLFSSSISISICISPLGGEGIGGVWDFEFYYKGGLYYYKGRGGEGGGSFKGGWWGSVVQGLVWMEMVFF